MATPNTGGAVRCVVVTPEKAVLDETGDAVTVPMYDGGLGVYPGRAPLIGRLGYGELRVRSGNQTRRLFVDGGFVQVRANVVTVLTPRALKVEEIDAAAARQALEESRRPGGTAEVQEQKLRAQARARALLHMVGQATT